MPARNQNLTEGEYGAGGMGPPAPMPSDRRRPSRTQRASIPRREAPNLGPSTSAPRIPMPPRSTGPDDADRPSTKAAQRMAERSTNRPLSEQVAELAGLMPRGQGKWGMALSGAGSGAAMGARLGEALADSLAQRDANRLAAAKKKEPTVTTQAALGQYRDGGLQM